MAKEIDLTQVMADISREMGIPVSRIASCPTADESGVSDGLGTVFFDDDDPQKRPLAVILREGIGETASANTQS